jgi:hypothetical protein
MHVFSCGYGAAMAIAMTLTAGADAELLETSVVFHLHAGVEHVTVVCAGSLPNELSGQLEPYAAAGRVAIHAGLPPPQAELSRHADWVIEAAAGEFWWPRGGSLDEVLTSVALRYDAVQALERIVLRSAGAPFFEHATQRLAPSTPFHDAAWRPARRLIRRTSVVPSANASAEPSVLRLWYPIEVLCVQEVLGEDARRQQALDTGVLVEDTRLRDALRSLKGQGDARWLIPAADGSRTLDFPPISPVDDALFALEAAAVGDIDVLEARELLDTLSRRLGAVERLTTVRAETRLRAARRAALRRLRGGGAAS